MRVASCAAQIILLLSSALRCTESFTRITRSLSLTYTSRPSVDRKASASAIGASSQLQVDVAVIGGGPAGTAIGWLLQEQQQCRVAIIDPKAADDSGTWYPNYGEWQDEWQCVADRLQLPELRECTTTEWDTTDVFFGGSYETPFETKTKLPREYVRVDRKRMQKLLKDRFRAAGGTLIPSKLEITCIAPNIFASSSSSGSDKSGKSKLVHHAEGSELVLEDGTSVSCRVVVDASGLESRLVRREAPYTARGVDKEIPTGYQIAYGFLTRVDSMGPYDPKAMTLFDYRSAALTAVVSSHRSIEIIDASLSLAAWCCFPVVDCAAPTT